MSETVRDDDLISLIVGSDFSSFEIKALKINETFSTIIVDNALILSSF